MVTTQAEKTKGAQGAKEKAETPDSTKSVVDIVSEKVTEFLKSKQLDLPKDYSVDNALKSAYLTLNTVKDKDDNPVMIDGKLTGVCTKGSIANAILDMVIQGLNPSKDQCYFVVYGKTLACFRSYFGSMAMAEMVDPSIKDWGYGVVYRDDEFKYGIQNGKAQVIEHIQEFANIKKEEIIGAYAMALDKEGKPIKTEIMTIEQIYQSWKQSPLKPFDDQGNLKPNSTHAKFPADMALRTVINKVAKFIINASSDNALLLERINRTEDLRDAVAVQGEIEEKANKGTLIMITEETVKKDASEAPGNPPANVPNGEGLPTPQEEQAELKKRGMVQQEKAQTRQPGW